MGSHSAHGDVGHAVPDSVFYKIFISLVILTVITVWVAKGLKFDSDAATITVAMIIASIKAMLVALWFMHLKYENPLTWLYAIFPIILLVVMIGGVMTDNPFRNDGRTLETVPPVRGHIAAAAGAEAHH